MACMLNSDKIPMASGDYYIIRSGRGKSGYTYYALTPGKKSKTFHDCKQESGRAKALRWIYKREGRRDPFKEALGFAANR